MRVEKDACDGYVRDMLDESVDAPPGDEIKPKMAATITLIVVNIIVFFCQMWIYKHRPQFPLDDYFALSLNGLKHGWLWQLLTFQFMHGGKLHIFFNMWGIFVFGRVLETFLGVRRMLTLYFLSGVIGGLCQMLGVWLVPFLFGGPDSAVVGASAGGFGLVAAFAVLFPKQPLYLLLLLVIPIKMRATTMVWLAVAISVVGIFLPLLMALAEVLVPLITPYAESIMPYLNWAHAAHLGGIATGFFFMRSLDRRHQKPQPPIVASPGKSSLNISPVPD